MKNLHYIFLFASIAGLVAGCSIREDLEECGIDPEPTPDVFDIYLAFECIEIFDTGDREIVFDKVADEIELLFYDTEGKLSYDLKYTSTELAESDWGVTLRENEVKPGDYTLLSLVNYDNQHFTLTGKESLENMIAGLKYGPARAEDNPIEINFPLKDTYYGYYELELDYDAYIRTHTIELSKNTNLINVTAIFQDEEDYKSITSFANRLTGNNTLYDWENKAINVPSVNYMPYESYPDEQQRRILEKHKTMRIWHGSDLTLELDITAGGIVVNQRQNISEWLAKDDRYDTDEKLEHYDEFNIEITYAKGLVIISVMINGWYVIDIGEPL